MEHGAGAGVTCRCLFLRVGLYNTLTVCKAHLSNYHGADVVKGEYQRNDIMLVEYS